MKLSDFLPTSFFPYLIVLIVLLLLVFFLKKPDKKNSYVAKEALLNGAEQLLFARLEEALGKSDAFLILAQVSLSQLFDFDKKETEFMQKLNAVARKSVDFLVCRRADFFIIAAVELNGPMHHLARQKKADSVKAHALQSAGIPLLIYTPDKLPSVFEIKQDFAPFLD